jgi:AraC-like DNA-binding protein
MSDVDDQRTPRGAGWAGGVIIGPGELAFRGRIGAASGHAHAAVQVLHVAEGAVGLRDATGREEKVTQAIIPAGARHELSASPGTLGTITYLDAAAAGGRAAMRQIRATGMDPADVRTWVRAAPYSAPSSDPASDPALHVALREALRMAPHLVDGPMLLADLAARVGLSAGRLGHLFADELGLPYPVWRRWVRLQHALGVVRRGASLTDAAHQAGFSDSAHLTRSCRSMFGLSPSEARRAIGGA